MAKQVKNSRCPFANECERKCEYIGAERKCDYYKNNAFSDNEIPDQKEIREIEEREMWKALEQEQESDESECLVYIDVDQIYPHPDNPRKDLGDLTELVESIKAKGILQPIVIVPGHEESAEGYTSVIGHRRHAASKLAGLTEVPCIITYMNRREQIETMLMENIQRSDLTMFEQAQSFQMIMDLGSTVDQISEKTGFSKRTVKRRLEMAKLDQDKLKAVSSRQLSLDDFDKLAEIDSIATRNEVLDKIGTNNFQYAVDVAKQNQNIKKALPEVKRQIASLGWIKLKDSSDTYSSKYDSDGFCMVNIPYDGDISDFVPKKHKGKQIYYWINEFRGYINLRVLAPKKKKETPAIDPKEAEHKQAVADAWAVLDSASQITHRMRTSFAGSIKPSSKNITDICEGLIRAGVYCASSYINNNKLLYELTKLEYKDGKVNSNIWERYKPGLDQLDLDQFALMVLALFEDNEKMNCTYDYRTGFPRYVADCSDTCKLTEIYAFLTKLGYEMSTNEKQLLDGTHKIYHIEESEETNE